MPDVVISCDWSMHPGKRWACRAIRAPGGHFLVEAPVAVANPQGLVAGARLAAGPGAWALLGFDNPIGLPRAFAGLAGIASFRSWLAGLPQPAWEAFASVCEAPGEVTLARPFYPRGVPVGVQRMQLTGALGLAWPQLLRRCERATGQRREACSLFWTLGGNQVGKAALAMWEQVLRPALAEGHVRVWPFDGGLPRLLVPGQAVLAETYPAESYHHVGVALGVHGGKRKQEDRRAQAPALMAWARNHGIVLSEAATHVVLDGFGPSEAGEDPFDALVGLLGMLEVVLGVAPDGVPADDAPVARVEGWILGQSAGAGA